MLKYENPGGPRRRPPQHEQRQVAVLQVRVLVLPQSKNPFEIISRVHMWYINNNGKQNMLESFFNDVWEDTALEAET